MDDARKLELPFMLWSLLNLDDSELISWGPKGDTIVLTKNAWNSYLANPVFDLDYKDWDEFSTVLINYGFDLLNCRKDPHKGILVHMKHKYFRRNRFDLLSKVICTKPKSRTINSTKNTDGKVGVISRDKLEQLRLYATIKFNSLKSKLEANNNKSSKENELSAKQIVKEVTPKVETNNESMIEFLTDCTPSYAGYYGEYSTEQLKQFFGEYLPTYGANGKIVVKPFKKEFQTLLDNSRNNISKPKNSRKFCKEHLGTQNYTPLSSPDEGNFKERTNELHEITKSKCDRKSCKEKYGTQNYIPISSIGDENFIERTTILYDITKRNEGITDYEYSDDDDDDMGSEKFAELKINDTEDSVPSTNKKIKLSEPNNEYSYDFLEKIDANTLVEQDAPVPQYVQKFLKKAAEEKDEKDDMRKDFSKGIKDLMKTEF